MSDLPPENPFAKYRAPAADPATTNPFARFVAPPPSPHEGETSLGSALWSGVLHGIGNIGTGAARIGARAVGGEEGIDQLAAERRATFENEPTTRQHPTATKIGEFGGEMLGTAPLAVGRGASVLGSALWSGLGGAGGGALSAGASAPADSFGGDVLTGGAIGGGLGGALGAGGAMLRPPVMSGGAKAPQPSAAPPEPTGPPIGSPFPAQSRLATVQPGAGDGQIIQRGTPPAGSPPSPASPAPRVAPPPEPKSWSEAARMLVDKDVRLSPGQARNMSEMERSLQSWPILRGFVRHEVGRSVDDFDRAVVRQALEPIGAAVPRTVPAGHGMMEFAAKRLGEAYDQVLPNVSLGRDGVVRRLQNDPELSKLVSEMASDDASRLAKIIENRVLAPDRYGPDGVMTGQVFKTLEHDLAQRADNFSGGSGDEIGHVLRRVLGSLRDELADQNPQFAPQLQKVNEAFSMFARVRAASIRDADARGKFTPHDLLQALKSEDPSSGGGSFSRGRAPMQAFAEAGNEVLGPSIASRTPEWSRSAARIAADTAAGAAGIVPYSAAWLTQRIPGLGRGVGALAPAVGVEAGRGYPTDQRDWRHKFP